MERRFGENRIEMDSKPDEETEAAIDFRFLVLSLKQIRESRDPVCAPRRGHFAQGFQVAFSSVNR